MISSMTGFGREHLIINGWEILVEIKSVNSRYFEFYAKMPKFCGFLEDKLKTLLKEKISRGKVELSLSLTNINGKEIEVAVNENAVKSYISALRKAGETFSLNDDLTVSSIFKMSDVFTVTKTEIDEEQLWNDVKSAALSALEKFTAMRLAEGEKMKADIFSKLDSLEKNTNEVEALSPQNTELYRGRLYEKLEEILDDKNIDEQRILMEAAVFAEKTAVDEETVRLKSHIAQSREMLNNENLVGRKLDFLVQEMNRETNTIGSKAQMLQITKLVVEMKSDIEKIREQIQNIE